MYLSRVNLTPIFLVGRYVDFPKPRSLIGKKTHDGKGRTIQRESKGNRKILSLRMSGLLVAVTDASQKVLGSEKENCQPTFISILFSNVFNYCRIKATV